MKWQVKYAEKVTVKFASNILGIHYFNDSWRQSTTPATTSKYISLLEFTLIEAIVCISIRTSSHFSFSLTSDFIKIHFHVSTIQNQDIEDRVFSSLMLQSNYVIYSDTKIYFKSVIRFLRTSSEKGDTAKPLLTTFPLETGASRQSSREIHISTSSRALNSGSQRAGMVAEPLRRWANEEGPELDHPTPGIVFCMFQL